MPTTSTDAPDRVIAELDKAGGEKFRISLCHFKGKQYVDLRTFYRDEADELKPGKGARLSAAFLPELLAALTEAERIVSE
jgi:hypothetical protein